MTVHIAEAELATYALDSERIGQDRRATIEQHLAACAECQATHDFFVVAEEALGDAETWEPIVGSATMASLMAYGARVAEEDEEAEKLLRPYIENPANAAWEALTTRRALQTGGVVRKLNAHAHSICESDPLAALTFTDAATSIANALPDDAYPAGAVNQLRGTAWKERANALMLLGQFPAALASLDQAERYYSRTLNNGLGLSMVALVRAGVFYEQQLYADALQHAQRAERGFAHVGDEKRRMDAVYLRGSIFMEAGDPVRALELYRSVIEYGESIGDRRVIARGSYVSGHAEVDRGDLDAAAMRFIERWSSVARSAQSPRGSRRSGGSRGSS